MKKISTLFKKNPKNLGRVINEIDPENAWVIQGDGIPTQKHDGTACAIINGGLYKRYDVKKGRSIPENAIQCQEPDKITGHHPHWVLCSHEKPEDKYFFEGYNSLAELGNVKDGTYELIGEKVNGNHENIEGHHLVLHGSVKLYLHDLSFNGIKDYLSDPKNDIEGIVFHHINNGSMCKIRKRDFGINRIKQIAPINEN